MGNLTLKGPTGNGKSYTYGTQSASCPTGALSKSHAVINDGTTSYCYDQNGNMLSGGNRSYAWDAESRPSSISSGGVSESYCYDADGERVKRAVGSMTTVYLGGLWEEVIGGAVKSYYTLNGTVVAVRDSGTNAVTYLHGDHLGSISVASNASAQATSQTFDPWGKRRSGGISQTSLNYTSQRLDSGTGLLYYHARYYDPVLGRFLSADTAVSGQNDMMGPANPQELNRYSYVNNNPLRYTDSTGHAVDPPPCVICDLDPIDISQWSEPAQGAAVVACLVLGCHVNNAVITAPTYEEWLQDQVLGMMPGPAVLRTVTSRAVGNRAQRFVLRIAQEAERRVLKKGAEGSLATAQAAAARGADILPGLFKYESQPSIAGYAQHHLWPQAMGGPKEGWTVYARNVHSAAGGIQDRMNVYLRTQLGMQQRQVEAWARQHPEAILDHLRQFYKAEGIGFPY